MHFWNLFVVGFLVLAPPAQAGTCLEMILGSEGYSFPADLKMGEARIEALIGTEHEGLVRTLGRIFYRISQNPQLLDRETLLSGEGFEESERTLLVQLLQNLKPVGMFPAELSWGAQDEARFGAMKLAYLKKELSSRPLHRRAFEALMNAENRFELMEEYRGILRAMLSQGFTLPTEEYEAKAAKILAAMARFQDRSKEPGSSSMSAHVAESLQFLRLRAFTSFYYIVPAIDKTFEERKRTGIELSTFIEEHRDLILAMAEDIYFKSELLPQLDHDAYMELVDFISLGTPFRYTANQVYSTMMESAKILLLPAKNHLSLQAQQKNLRWLEEARNKIVVTPFVLNLKLEPPAPSFNRDKVKSGPNGLVITTIESRFEDTLKPFTKFAGSRKSFSDLKADFIYQTSFLRDKKSKEQKVKFSVEVITAMNELTNEAYQTLDGFLVGFADNRHHGAGIKRLTDARTSRTHEPIFEARPNRDGYRLILLKREGVWEVVSFTHKSTFDRELDRVRSL